MNTTELIKKELEKQILLLSKLSERKVGLTVCKRLKISHEIAQLSYTLLVCEERTNRQSLSSCGGRASKGWISEQP